jgi:hypothetical protein
VINERKILCLAASRKHAGLCFAGLDVASGEWIRPVSSRPKEEVSFDEARLADGSVAKPLDILRIPILRHVPKFYQSENYLIDPARRWSKADQGTWQMIDSALTTSPDALWTNGDASKGFAFNRVSTDQARGLRRSLSLIRPERLVVSIKRKGGNFGDRDKRVKKGKFRYSGIEYCLSVTDPKIEDMLERGKDREIDMTGAALCVSLGEEYNGHAYKLIAAVLVPT